MARVTHSVSTDGIHTVATSLTTSQTLLYANEGRRGATIYNNSSAILYILCQNDPASGASSSNFTNAIASDSYFELPFGYTGEVHGAWASANGDAQITEFE